MEGVANLGDLLFVMPSLEDSDDFDEGASEAITILSPELRWELLCEMWTRTKEMSAVITNLSPLGVGESSVDSGEPGNVVPGTTKGFGRGQNHRPANQGCGASG